jgi:TatD DNase family protein
VLYDAHCHLQDPSLERYLPKIAETLRAIGVRKVVVNGTREEDWPRVLEIARTYDFVIPALGLHPWYIKPRQPNWAGILEESAAPALGEIGLDRWVRGYDAQDQERVFVEQLALAARCNLPVSIHCLKAWGRLREILESEQVPEAGFLLHSYGGPAEMIRRLADLGGYFSISGYFAHERKARQREVFRAVPFERLLIETDAPDMLLPAEIEEFKLEDGLNHPANLRAVYRFAAGLRGTSEERLAGIVEENFQRLFRRALIAA